MTDTRARYAKHQQDRCRLQELFKTASGLFERLELPSDKSMLDRGQAKLSADTFKVLVLGEFKRGKSTFINALLGQEVLPAFSIPCTAVINEIKWGAEKQAVLHFSNPAPLSFPKSLPEEVYNHRAKYQGADLPPMQIPVNEIERYVVIPDPAKDQGDSVAESPYSMVEILWPIDLCQNGVEIIDSPGLNEHGTRTRITTDYLSKVDAVIFVLSCQALASQTELQFIDLNIRGSGHEDMFLVCNRFDEVRPSERDRIVTYGRAKLSDKTTFGAQGVYFLSALSALEGRLQSDRSRVEQSGINLLEDHLSTFLTKDRGRIKLLQPARDLRRLLNKIVFEYIPGQHKMLDVEVVDLERRYAEVKPRLDDAERKRSQIKEKIKNGRLKLSDSVRREVSHLVKDMASAIPGWLETYEPQSKIKFFAVSTKKQAEELIKELVAYVSSRIEQEQSKWQKSTLQPLMKERLEELGEGVRADIQNLLQSVDDVKSHLGAVDDASQKDVDAFERVLAAAGGLLIGGAGSAFVGGMRGFKEMLKSLLPNIVLASALLMFTALNPIALVFVLMTAGSIQGMLGAGAAAKEIKIKVGQRLASTLRDSAEETAEKGASEVFLRTEVVMQQLDEGLQKEIGGVRESVEVVLTAKRQGDAQVRQRRGLIDQVMASTKTLQSDLDDLLFALQAKV